MDPSPLKSGRWNRNNVTLTTVDPTESLPIIKLRSTWTSSGPAESSRAEFGRVVRHLASRPTSLSFVMLCWPVTAASVPFKRADPLFMFWLFVHGESIMILAPFLSTWGGKLCSFLARRRRQAYSSWSNINAHCNNNAGKREKERSRGLQEALQSSLSGGLH